jgi:hypothetical protein
MIPLGRQPAEGYRSGFTRKSQQISKLLRNPPGFMRFLPLRIRRLQVQVLPDAPHSAGDLSVPRLRNCGQWYQKHGIRRVC